MTARPTATDHLSSQRLLVVAFGAGGFDAAGQLGFAHALLVARGAAPDYVTGISAGAICAAALAEVLHAGGGLADREKLDAQVDRLRSFLASFAELPHDLLQSLVPDAFELNANQPLPPLALPIHFDAERRRRAAANRSRDGLIRLLNLLLDCRLPISAVTVAANRVLRLVAAGNQGSWWRRSAGQAPNLLSLWLLGHRYMAALAPTLRALVVGALTGRRPAAAGRTAGELIGGIALLRRLRRQLLHAVTVILFQIAWLAAPLAILASKLLAWRRPDRLGRWGRRLLDRLLGHFDVASGLGDRYAVQQHLIRCFDRDYFGRPDMNAIVDQALSSSHTAARSALGGERKSLSRYAEGDAKIVVAPIAAEVGTGELRVLPDDIPVVDALLAATAYVPLFPALPLPSRKYRLETGSGQAGKAEACGSGTAGDLELRWFIDGRHVSAEPVGAVMELLRRDPRLDEFGSVEIYQVSNLGLDSSERTGREPPDAATGAAEHGEYSGLLAVARRALALKRFRDATMEQRLTGLYSKALPPGRARVTIAGKTYVRANIRRIGPDRPASLNREVLLGRSALDLKELLYEVVADGCRAALEAMIPDAIAAVAAAGDAAAAGGGAAVPTVSPAAPAGAPAAGAASTPEPADRSKVINAEAAGSVRCMEAIRYRLRDQTGDRQLPGSGTSGPGLDEICRRCALFRPSAQDPRPAPTQHLKQRQQARYNPPWPLLGAVAVAAVAPGLAPATRVAQEPGAPAAGGAAGSGAFLPPGAMRWPRDRRGLQGDKRPLVSLLFGGGVFRGVFHLGVMNALNELGLEPDLVAGSSVGAIIAAMIARVFADGPSERRQRIGLLAGTFLAIDRLVMTDRLADFFQGLALRASEAHFSLRDMDLVLRRYDLDPAHRWSRRARQVTGGIERLFHLSPAELLALTMAVREGDLGRFALLLGDAVQNFLDRGGVGEEILGTEPLSLLIAEQVVRGLAGPPSDGLFQGFQASGIHFLATATNLTRGWLDVLGSASEQRKISLLHGLLASSAFPGVFRPQRSWEIFRAASDMDQYIDGGTMDNLPLDAVGRFLDQGSWQKLLARRPRARGKEVPHLLFTASLEVDKAALTVADALSVCGNFMRLGERARTLSCNRKVDAYANVQRNLRDIHRDRIEHGSYAPHAWQPLDLHLIAVRPRWLCSTFGFHPMLGFRRNKQAESMAHGCASTLASLFAESRGGDFSWLNAWGVRGLDDLDDRALAGGGGLAPLGQKADGTAKPPGTCWFRRTAPCPFYSPPLTEPAPTDPHPAPPEGFRRELTAIYQACGNRLTHMSPRDHG